MMHLSILCIIDIDECSIVNSCNQICNNTIGSYYCACQTGYTLSNDSHTCTGIAANLFCMYVTSVYLDINECSTSNGGCEQTCQNTQGSYQCSCWNGYSLDADKHNCTGL